MSAGFAIGGLFYCANDSCDNDFNESIPMGRGDRYSILSLLVLMTVIALILVFPAQIISLFFAAAALVVFVLMVGTIRDLLRTTDRGDRRMIVPLLLVGLVMLGSIVLSIYFFFFSI